MNIAVYTGDAAATYKKIQSGIDEIFINKVYKSKTSKCLFYINNKGFLHILQPERENYNGRITGYYLTDSILSRDNMIEYKKDYTRKYKTIEELQAAILEMIA